MKQENHQLHSLRTLILKSQAETLTESEIAELNALIQAEGGAEEAVALFDQLCAFSDTGALDSLPMAEVLSELPIEQSNLASAMNAATFPETDVRSQGVTNTNNPAPSSIWISPAWLPALLVSHLLFAWAVWFLMNQTPIHGTGNQLASEMISPQPEFGSPQLVSMTACVWHSSSGGLAPSVGEPIQSGELLNLVEGIAELSISRESAGEALVRIEGPASVFIRNNGQFVLRRGAMTVKSLGVGSLNVELETPVGTVLMDGQSSIGLVANGFVDEVHLFSGRALVKPLPFGNVGSEVALEEGEAIRYSYRSTEDYEAEVVRFEASLARFASARSSGFDPLEIGSEYVKAVLNSKPSVYWRFEEVEGEASATRFVKNQGSLPGMNAAIVGEPGWRQYGQNRVAELGQSTSSAFRAIEPWPAKPLDNYTIEIWVKPQLFHHGDVFCLHAVEALEDGRYPHTMMLETTAQHHFTHSLSESPSNRFRFVHRGLRSNANLKSTSLFAEDQYQARVWQHVVAQKKGDQQLLWIDGQLSAERSNSVPLTENVQILVGQVYPDSNHRRFVGQIDEVAIYDRCLSQTELREHIKAAGRKVANRVSD